MNRESNPYLRRLDEIHQAKDKGMMKLKDITIYLKDGG